VKNTRNLIEDLKKYFNNNADMPNESEYNMSDEAVRMFFSSLETKNIRLAMNDIKNDSELVEAFINEIEDVAEAESLAVLRYAYHNLQKATNTSDNEAILVEDLDQDIEDLSVDEHRYEAANALRKFSELKPDFSSIADDVINLILEGSDLPSATRLVKTVFSNSIPTQNIKLAYTSLSTQNNEPFQMCPKAVRQLGYAVPMEISKCVNNCIDSRKSLDGTVSCAYQDWSKLVQDNQTAFLARLSNSRFNDNKNIKLLNDITRPGRDEVERSLEFMRENDKNHKSQETKYKFTELRTQSTETNLSNRSLNTHFDNPDKTQKFSTQTADENNPKPIYQSGKYAENSEKRIITAQTEDNNITISGDNMKKFNLAEYITANSINDKLDQARDFFDDYGYENPMSMNTGKSTNEKYEDAKSMEDLISEKHVGESNIVLEDMVEDRRLNNETVGTTPMNTRLNERRKNDPDSEYMKTMEERLRQHSGYTTPLKNQSPPAKSN